MPKGDGQMPLTAIPAIKHQHQLGCPVRHKQCKTVPGEEHNMTLHLSNHFNFFKRFNMASAGYSSMTLQLPNTDETPL